MKVVAFNDKYLYRKLFMAFAIYDEEGNIVGSEYDENVHYFFHFLNKDYVNCAINSLDGLRNIYALILQKSWFRNVEVINICKMMKMLHPESKVIVYMDVNYEDYQYFCHRIVDENLGMLAFSEEDMLILFENDLEIDQGNYRLPKITRKMKKQYSVH